MPVAAAPMHWTWPAAAPAQSCANAAGAAMAISTAAVRDARTGVLLLRRRAIFTKRVPLEMDRRMAEQALGHTPQRADIAIPPRPWLPPAVGGASKGQTSANGVASLPPGTC